MTLYVIFSNYYLYYFYYYHHYKTYCYVLPFIMKNKFHIILLLFLYFICVVCSLFIYMFAVFNCSNSGYLDDCVMYSLYFFARDISRMLAKNIQNICSCFNIG